MYWHVLRVRRIPTYRVYRLGDYQGRIDHALPHNMYTTVLSSGLASSSACHGPSIIDNKLRN